MSVASSSCTQFLQQFFMVTLYHFLEPKCLSLQIRWHLRYGALHRITCEHIDGESNVAENQ
jgi:hypothetical protein